MSSGKNDVGTLVISLDLELCWGVLSKYINGRYEKRLRGTRKAVESILELFKKYDIHATWAAVGFLFASNVDELEQYLPAQKPSYQSFTTNPFSYLKQNASWEEELYFAPGLIKRIASTPNQEIGTHTFSHYYAHEKGQTIEAFSSDLESAIQIAASKGLNLTSLVFPRNQYTKEHLSVLKGHGITSYRGNPNVWLFKVKDHTKGGFIKRSIRLMDAYFNVSGPNTYELQEIGPDKPYNIQASRFLRPVSKPLAIFEGFRKQRIANSMRHAAQHGEVYHLWWHPHNFGVDTKENLKFLEFILAFYIKMADEYGMQSLNMREIGDLISENTKCV